MIGKFPCPRNTSCPGVSMRYGDSNGISGFQAGFPTIQVLQHFDSWPVISIRLLQKGPRSPVLKI